MTAVEPLTFVGSILSRPSGSLQPRYSPTPSPLSHAMKPMALDQPFGLQLSRFVAWGVRSSG